MSLNMMELTDQLTRINYPHLFIGNQFNELKKAYENEESSDRVCIPVQLNPLTEANIQHALWCGLENLGTVWGEVSIKKKYIDIVLNFNGLQIGIEVKEDVNYLSGNSDQFKHYLNSRCFNLLFCSSLAWKTNIEYCSIIRSDFPDFGVFTLSPFGQLFLNREPTYLQIERDEDKNRTKYKKEAKIRHILWKWFRKEGYFVTAESKLPGGTKFRPKISFSPLGTGTTYVKKQPHIPRLDLTAVEKNCDFISPFSEIIGIEAKVSKKSVKIDQLKKYKESRNLMKLCLALPSNIEEIDDIEKLLSENELDDVGIILVDVEKENVKEVKKAEKLWEFGLENTVLNIFVKSGRITTEDSSRDSSRRVKLHQFVDF